MDWPTSFFDCRIDDKCLVDDYVGYTNTPDTPSPEIRSGLSKSVGAVESWMTATCREKKEMEEKKEEIDRKRDTERKKDEKLRGHNDKGKQRSSLSGCVEEAHRGKEDRRMMQMDKPWLHCAPAAALWCHHSCLSPDPPEFAS